MSVMQLIFIIIAAISLGGALMVVTTRNLVHAALWLILTLFGVAVLFVLLNAGFLAIVQVVVYIGAIAILMIFAIMLTRQVMGGVDNTRSAKANEELPKEMDKNEVENKLPQTSSSLNSIWMWAALLSIILFSGLVWVLSRWVGFNATVSALPANLDPLQQLGQALISPNGYVIPFEVASILLLGALIGAIAVAWERK
jgi:NADH-quinone oxidoreductase subunit J